MPDHSGHQIAWMHSSNPSLARVIAQLVERRSKMGVIFPGSIFPGIRDLPYRY